MPRGDGRLTHDLIPGEKGPQDACGVFGVWAPGEDVAKLTYFGLYALQHRGQESAGIATSDGQRHPRLQGHGPGLPGVRRAPRSRRCAATSRSATAATPPPAARPGRTPSPPSAATPAARSPWPTTATSPTPPSCATSSTAGAATTPTAVSSPAATPPTPRWSPRCSPTTPTAPSRPPRSTCCPGCAAPSASSSWTSTRSTPRRDPHGIRPLVLGRLERGWVVASETAALDIVGASFVREVEPGELVVDRRGRPALAALRRADAQGLRLRVRLPGPPRHHDQRPRSCTRPGSRWAARWRASTRSTPTW